MNLEEKLEQAWLVVVEYPDGSPAQIVCAHHFVCHLDGSDCDPAKCHLAVDREALHMLDLARYVRDDEQDETEFRKRWAARSAS